MVQAKWGSMRWEITDDVFKTLTSISTSQSVKKQTNNDNEGSSATSNQGLELQKVTITFTVLKGLGVDPYIESEIWRSHLAESNPIYLGNQRFGALNMQLQSVGLSNVELDNAGNKHKGDISLSFEENAEEASEAKIGITVTTGLVIKPSAADKSKKKTKVIQMTK